ncbi:MAG: hypothetical protein NT062_19760 [Proteobacteria bacterium]|nr:hypothetical protein [Pseudomonadota bacterium]
MSVHYFDDPDEGPTPATSHPAFRKLCKGAFFYDIGDDFAPFGSDAGADTLASLEDWYRAPRPRKVRTFISELLDGWGFTLPNLRETREAVVLRRLADPSKETEMLEIDGAVIATAFAQLKITGAIDLDVQVLARAALARDAIYVAHARVAYPKWPHAKEKAAAQKKLAAVLAKLG